MRRTRVVSLLSTRSVTLSGAMLIAVALVIMSLAVSPADAATKLVTKTFSSSGLILIPDGAVFAEPPSICTGDTVGAAAPYPSEKSVSAFPRGSRIKDANLTLKNYSHNDVPDDVDVLLAHAGRNRTVMSDVGGIASFVNNITIVLNDEAKSALPDAGQLVGGSFKPTNFDADDGFPTPAPAQDNRSALSGFDGQNPNKTWKLFVQDDADFDCGKLGGGWSLTIRAAVPA
jgi:hypothetical protein